MENKMYELMEKMYLELQETKKELKSDIKELTGNVHILKEGFHELKSDVKKIENKLENETNEKIRAMFDDREVQKEINEKFFSSLERIEAKVDVLQVETAHIRRIK